MGFINWLYVKFAHICRLGLDPLKRAFFRHDAALMICKRLGKLCRDNFASTVRSTYLTGKSKSASFMREVHIG